MTTPEEEMICEVAPVIVSLGGSVGRGVSGVASVKCPSNLGFNLSSLEGNEMLNI